MQISLICSLILFVAAVQAGHHKSDQKWKDHAGKHGLKFKDDDQEARSYANYQETDKKIKEHNEGNFHFKIGHNEFSHLNQTELEKRNGHRHPKIIQVDSRKRSTTYSISIRSDGAVLSPAQPGQFPGYIYSATTGYVAPASLDWVSKGFNKPVLNQMCCGSCWAFATAAGMEASLYANNKTSVTLSPQQFVSCDMLDGGCDGGVPILAYMYANQNGITSAVNYPYTSSINYSAGVDGACYTSKSTIAPTYRPKSFYFHFGGDDKAVIEMLNKFGPLTIAMDASGNAFQYYTSGIYAVNTGVCGTTANHAMLLVGYGVDTATNIPYWLIKNQYGTSWGLNGYMKLARNRVNNCGISTSASVPFF